MIITHTAMTFLIGALLALTGCAHSPETTLGPDFGDAVRGNIAAQVIVPDAEVEALAGTNTLTGEQAERALERLWNASPEVRSQPLIRDLVQ